jgi:hypothetical protein
MGEMILRLSMQIHQPVLLRPMLLRSGGHDGTACLSGHNLTDF